MAGTKIAEAFVAVSADMAGLSAGMRQGQAITTSAVNSMQRSLGGLQSMLGMIGVGVGFGAIISGIRGTIAEAQVAMDSQSRLAAAVETSGKAAGFTAGQLATFATELQNATTAGDETIKDAMTTLTTFPKVAGEMFKRATKAALDMQEKGFGGMGGNARMLGRALEDPRRGLMMLTRMGVTFSEQQRKQIKDLMEQNKLGEAQQVIMGAVEGKFKGVAEAMAKTPSGRIKQLTEATGDLREEIGTRLMPLMVRWKETQFALTKSVLGFVEWAAPMVGGFADQWARLNESTGGFAAKIAVGSAAVLTLLPLISMAGRALAMFFPMDLFRLPIRMIGTLGGMIGGLTKPLFAVASVLTGTFASAWKNLQTRLSNVLDHAHNMGRIFGSIVQQGTVGAFNLLGAGAERLGFGLQMASTLGVGALSKIDAMARSIPWGTMWSGVSVGAKVAFGGALATAAIAYKGIAAAASAAWPAIKGALRFAALQTGWNGLVAAANTSWQRIVQISSSAASAVKAAILPIGGAAWQTWKTIEIGAVTAWKIVRNTMDPAYLKATWDGIKVSASATWQNISTTAQGAWSVIKTTFDPAYLKAVWDGWRSGGESMWARIKGGAQNAWQTIKNTFDPAYLKAAWTDMKTAAMNAWTSIKTRFSALGPQIGVALRTGVNMAWTGIIAAGKATFTTLGSLAAKTGAMMGRSLRAVGGGIAGIAGGLAGLSMMGGVFAFLAPFQTMLIVLPQVMSLLGSVGMVVGALASPFGLVAGAIVGGLALWTRYSETGKGALDSVKKAFGPVWDVAKDTFGGIKDALTSGDIGLAGQIAITSLQTAFYTGLGELNAKFGEYIGTFISYWTNAFKKISEMWLKFQSTIAQGMVNLAMQKGVVGDIMAAMLGRDYRKMQTEADATAKASNQKQVSNLRDSIASLEAKVKTASTPGGIDAVKTRRVEVQTELADLEDAPGESEIAGMNLAGLQLIKQMNSLQKAGEDISGVQKELDALTEKLNAAQDAQDRRIALGAELRNLDEAIAGAADPNQVKEWQKTIEQLRKELEVAAKGPVAVNVADEATKGLKDQTDSTIAGVNQSIDNAGKSLQEGINGAAQKGKEALQKGKGLNALAELGSDITGVVGEYKDRLAKASELETADLQVTAIQAAKQAAMEDLAKEVTEAITQGADKDAVAKKAKESQDKITAMYDEASEAAAKRKTTEGAPGDGEENAPAPTEKGRDPFVGFAELNRKMQEALLKDTLGNKQLDVAEESLGVQKDMLDAMSDEVETSKPDAPATREIVKETIVEQKPASGFAQEQQAKRDAYRAAQEQKQREFLAARGVKAPEPVSVPVQEPSEVTVPVAKPSPVTIPVNQPLPTDVSVIPPEDVTVTTKPVSPVEIPISQPPAQQPSPTQTRDFDAEIAKIRTDYADAVRRGFASSADNDLALQKAATTTRQLLKEKAAAEAATPVAMQTEPGIVPEPTPPASVDLTRPVAIRDEVTATTNVDQARAATEKANLAYRAVRDKIGRENLQTDPDQIVERAIAVRDQVAVQPGVVPEPTSPAGVDLTRPVAVREQVGLQPGVVPSPTSPLPVDQIRPVTVADEILQRSAAEPNTPPAPIAVDQVRPIAVRDDLRQQPAGELGTPPAPAAVNQVRQVSVQDQVNLQPTAVPEPTVPSIDTQAMLPSTQARYDREQKRMARAASEQKRKDAGIARRNAEQEAVETRKAEREYAKSFRKQQIARETEVRKAEGLQRLSPEQKEAKFAQDGKRTLELFGKAGNSLVSGIGNALGVGKKENVVDEASNPTTRYGDKTSAEDTSGVIAERKPQPGLDFAAWQVDYEKRNAEKRKEIQQRFAEWQANREKQTPQRAAPDRTPGASAMPEMADVAGNTAQANTLLGKLVTGLDVMTKKLEPKTKPILAGA